MIRVLIADAETLVRDGLKFIFEEASDICVVAEASNGDEVVAEYERCQPDVAVLDVAMPWGEGLDSIEQLAQIPQFGVSRKFQLSLFTLGLA